MAAVQSLLRKNMKIDRIWKGYKEYSDIPYFVGQVLIKEGRLKGCYKNVTDKYDSKEKVLDSVAEA